VPKIGPIGEGKLGILVILDGVSKAQEDNNGTRQGSHYLYLKKRLKDVGITIEKDCWTVNAIRCYSSKEDYGIRTVSGCAKLLQADIKRLKPKIIIPTSEIAWDVLFSNRLDNSRADGSLWDYATNIIPDQELKTWIAPIYSTHFLIEAENEIIRKRKEYGDHYKGHNRFEPFYTNHLNNVIEHLNKPVPIFEYKDKVKIAKNVGQAISYIQEVMTWKKWFFDYETTGLAWHNPEQKIHSVSFSDGNISYAMRWYPDNEEFMHYIKLLYSNDAVKGAFNMGFERSWSIGRAGVEPKNLIHDPMLMAHVWRNLAPTGLKYCLYREFGIAGYDDDMEQYLKPSKEATDRIGKNALNTIFSAPIDKVLYYVGLDSLFTYWLGKFYLNNMDKEHMLPGYELLAEAERPLTHMHLTGLRVDMEALNHWKPILQERIDTQYAIIMNRPLIRNKWMGGKFKPGSDSDIRTLLYKILKFKPVSFTDKGLPSVDSDAIEHFRDDLEIADSLLEYRRWYKVLNTFIAQLEREQWDGTVYSYFSLNGVDSYRSSGNKVNLMNQPKHDAEVLAVIRSLFIPRPGCFLSEGDFAQLEVRANAAITGDKNLKAAVSGGLDMHTVMSVRLFMLDETQKNKKARNVAKTNVFRLFYGGSGEQMAEGTWKIIHSKSAQDQLGIDMKTHLKQKGIDNYDKWVDHCKKTEQWLWGELFPDYQKWRKQTHIEYQRCGNLQYPNGFTYQGVASRNALLNGPGQGAGFHINLNAIVNIFNELERRGMNTKLVAEIHDSCIGDVVPEEEEEYKKILYKHMVKRASVYSPWVGDVPLEVEYSRADCDCSWAEIKTVGVLHG
jgi:DNA polymerase I-like protein with 3'-5' exonuclease and polymerase domains